MVTPPDSGEREVIVVNAPAAHCASCGTPMIADEIHCEDCSEDLREDEVSQDGTADLAILPLSLAQRIIGALERCAEHSRNQIAEALAAELRERIP